MLRSKMHVGMPVKIRMRTTGRYEMGRIMHIPPSSVAEVRISYGDRMVHREDGEIEPRDFVPADGAPPPTVQIEE